MRFVLSILLTTISLIANAQDSTFKVTVIFFDNQNAGMKLTIDTLVKERIINVSETPVDLFFACKNFHLPYYVPTDGIFKNEAKIKSVI